jgi:hypothetical protein
MAAFEQQVVVRSLRESERQEQERGGKQERHSRNEFHPGSFRQVIGIRYRKSARFLGLSAQVANGRCNNKRVELELKSGMRNTLLLKRIKKSLLS